MHLLYLFGILSVLFAGLTSGGKIIHKARNVSRYYNAGSDDRRPSVIHQYICHNKFTDDDTIKELDEKMKLLISLLQTKVYMPWNQATFSRPASSCKEIYEQKRSRANGAYMLRSDCGSMPVYCHMTSPGAGACGGGGWSLVMKIDGEKGTFHYDSHYWTDKKHYNLDGGKTGFDSQETKLPTYWNTPFSKICLGMRIGYQIKFIALSKHAKSLHSLIAGGQYHNISVGPDTWKTLIGSGASLQTGCNKEGVNVYDSYQSRTRIGIVGSRDPRCSSKRSRIGFGTGGYPDNTNACGSEAEKAMGYILVQ